MNEEIKLGKIVFVDDRGSVLGKYSPMCDDDTRRGVGDVLFHAVNRGDLDEERYEAYLKMLWGESAVDSRVVAEHMSGGSNSFAVNRAIDRLPEKEARV